MILANSIIVGSNKVIIVLFWFQLFDKHYITIIKFYNFILIQYIYNVWYFVLEHRRIIIKIPHIAINYCKTSWL